MAEVFMGLVVALVIVTLVGHGIWVGVEALLGKTDPKRRAQRLGARLACPRCETPLRASTRECAVCGWPSAPRSKADRARALEALRRRLSLYNQLGVFDDDARAQLARAVNELQQRVAKGVAPAPPTRSEPTPPSPRPAPPPKTPAQPHKPQQPLTPPTPAASPPPPETKPTEPVPSEPGPAAQPPSAPSSVGDRARRYAEHRAASPAQPTAAPPKPPRREALSRVLAAFMEEKNIRWGELVGGLLIVFSSVALVLSFWAEIAERPLLKFTLFNGVTAALFAVGFYTHRKWKIHTTSTGLLVIATLLVPLNFLAIAAFTLEAPPTDFVTLAGEGLSIVVFSSLVYFAGRVITPGAPVWLAVGVVAPSVMQLVVRRVAEPNSSLVTLYMLAVGSMAAYLASGAWAVRRELRGGEPTEASTSRFLVLVGLVTAATLPPLGLLAHCVRPTYAVTATLHWLAPLWAIYGAPALATGLYFWRRVADDRLTQARTSGLSVGALGAAVMVAAVAFAWPDPATLLPTALLVAAVLAGVGFGLGIPAAHVPAGVAAAVALLVAFHLARGAVPWAPGEYRPLSRALLSAASGHALAPIAGLLGALGWGLARGGRREDAAAYGLVAAAGAAVSLLLLMGLGFARAGDPQGVAWTLLLYAVAGVVAAAVVDRAAVAWTAVGLAAAALVQLVVFRYADAWRLEQPWFVALAALATLALVGYAAATRWSREQHAALRGVLPQAAFGASVLAALLLLTPPYETSYAAVAGYLLWLVGLWAVLSLVFDARELVTLALASGALVVFFAVAAVVSQRPWYSAARFPWADPWFLQAQGAALAVYCLAIDFARWRLKPREAPEAASAAEQLTVRRRAARLLVGAAPVDQALAVVLVVVLTILSGYAAAPGAAQELRPLPAPSGPPTPAAAFALPGVPHTHASGAGAWALLACVGATLSLGAWWRRAAEWRAPALTITFAATCPLLAAQWEADLAVASALRWIVTGLLILASAAIWFRGRAPAFQRLGEGSATVRQARDTLLAVVFAVYALMAAYVAQAALSVGGYDRAVLAWIPYVVVWLLVIGGLVVAAPALSLRPGGPSAQSDANHAQGRTLFAARHAQAVLVAGALVVLVAMVVGAALQQHPVAGPAPGTLFHRMGWPWSYGAPLAVAAVVLAGYAVRDGSSGFAFAGALTLNVAVTTFTLLQIGASGSGLGPAALVTVVQVNMIVSAACALAWMAALDWAARAKDGPAERPTLLAATVLLAALLGAALVAPATTHLVVDPTPNAWAADAGGVWGWAALVLTGFAAWFLGRKHALRAWWPWAIAAVATMAGLTALRWDSGDWLAYHTLMVGCGAAAWATPFASAVADRASPSPARWVRWCALFSVLAAVVSVRALWGDPQAPWWSVGVLAASGALMLGVAWREAQRGFVWWGAALVQVAGGAWWLEVGRTLTATPPGPGRFFDFLLFNALLAALVALLSVVIESRTIGPRRPTTRGVALHRVVAWAIAATLLLTAATGLAADAAGRSIDLSFPLAWGAWLAGVAVAIACWWDPRVRWPAACLYMVGLAAVGLYLDGLDFRGPMFRWALACALGAYALATSFLWNRRDTLRSATQRLGVPLTRDDRAGARDGGPAWLIALNSALAALVLLLAAWVITTDADFGRRMVVAYALGAQALALGLIAQGAARGGLQYASLVFGVLFAVAFGWAWLPPDFPAPWLHRTVAAVVALSAVIALYGGLLMRVLRRTNEWTRAAQKLVPLLAVLAGALLLMVIGVEVNDYLARGESRVAWPAVVAVTVALVGLAAFALVLALVPGRDPFELSERGRTAYVYVAEALLALTFVHIRVTMPWLFSGWFLRFWPLVVMGIAFVGVGLGEAFRRRKQAVLAEPLHNTGALLPLLPALGFWVTSSEVHYSLLLLSIGVLYAGLSVARRSFAFAVLAAVAANGSLWYLLHTGGGLGFLQHPQLWLIPPALCVLAGAYLNRAQLTAKQSAAIRYACAIVIYVSSTADIFINGVAQAPWLPAVLAGLSILGVLAGIVLRVRAFVYLGTAFLLVALVTVIWHAAVEQQRTWILWIAGIVTGVLIIALFGLFEKRRDDVLRVVEQLKRWDP